MVDQFSYGDVRRLNPEAPVPLIHIEREEYRLWWAANVAINVASLVWTVDLIGVVGKDTHGDMFSDLCKNSNVIFHSLDDIFPTITKQRFIENTYRQQLLRVDYEHSIQLWLKHRQMLINIITTINPDFIIVSDYNKWTINESIIVDLKEISQKLDIKILVDTKVKNADFFKNIYLVKPNLKEFSEFMNVIIENTNDDLEKYGKIFVKNWNTNLIVTRGKHWASLITQWGQVIHIPTQAKDIFDVTWAGDTFMATLTVALSRWHDLQQSVLLANKASGIVVGKIGTAVVHMDEIPEL